MKKEVYFQKGDEKIYKSWNVDNSAVWMMDA